MAYETKDNTGSLFVNNKKDTDRHPDWTGSARIEGHDYWVSVWKSDGRSAKTHSMQFKRKDGTADRPAPPQPAQRSIDLDDSVPF